MQPGLLPVARRPQSPARGHQQPKPELLLELLDHIKPLGKLVLVL
jgi:hypothetical protein